MTEMALRSRAKESESIGGQDNGHTLEGLAQRLETLERENERTRSENAELRHKLTTLEGSATDHDEIAPLRGPDTHRDHQEPAPAFEGQMSRRALLSKAGAAAVAAVAAGTLLDTRQARATHLADGISVDFVRTHSVSAQADNGDQAVEALTVSNTSPALHASNNGSRPAVDAHNSGAGDAVFANSRNGTGVKAFGVTGVWGSSVQAGQPGVYGHHFGDISGPGVVGDGKGADYAGVLGRNNTGTGVRGESAEIGYSGVYGLHTGTLGYGVYGLGKGSRTAGVIGRHHGAGYGGQFEGGRAQLWLVPKSTAGKPTSGAHTKGEIYMDSAGALFVCVRDGTPGTWRRLTTTAA